MEHNDDRYHYHIATKEDAKDGNGYVHKTTHNNIDVTDIEISICNNDQQFVISVAHLDVFNKKEKIAEESNFNFDHSELINIQLEFNNNNNK